MRVALVGYGRMGRAIEAAARSRGHEVVAIVDRRAEGALRTLDPGRLEGAEAAFEFTEPGSAREHVIGLLEAGIGVVCGTTGWNAEDRAVAEAAARGGSAAVIAPNFSVGMNLFLRVAAEAARRLLPTGLYDPHVLESHHRGKVDAPSGTALALARILASVGGEEIVRGIPERPVPRGAIHVASVRAGHEPGSHTVGFDGEHDEILLIHRARGRTGFAAGAVLAAEWLPGRTGRYGFDAVLDDLASGTREGGRR